MEGALLILGARCPDKAMDHAHQPCPEEGGKVDRDSWKISLGVNVPGSSVGKGP